MIVIYTLDSILLGNFVRNNFKNFYTRKNCNWKILSLYPLSQEKLEWGRGIGKVGRPFLGWYVKMGQSRTWDGWVIQMSLKKWDVLYGLSHSINKKAASRWT